MPRRHVVEDLNEEQLDFVLRCITSGDNDRQVCVKFERAFKTDEERPTLAKSSLHRWRTTAGEEMIDRYRYARFQAKALVEQIGEEDRDKYQIAIENIEEQLLTATREAIKENPSKMLLVRQREENFRLKREQIQLKREEIALKREQLHGAALDKVKLSTEFMQDFLEYLDGNQEGIQFLSRQLKPFGDFIQNKYGTTES